MLKRDLTLQILGCKIITEFVTLQQKLIRILLMMVKKIKRLKEQRNV